METGAMETGALTLNAVIQTKICRLKLVLGKKTCKVFMVYIRIRKKDSDDIGYR